MQKIKEAAEDFLACRRIAVTGVSRTPANHGSNVVYKRLRERGYDVYAVNPNAETVEGDPSFPSLEAVPGGVEAVVIGTRPELAEQTMKECIDLGITKVWMHRAFGGRECLGCRDRARPRPRGHGHRWWLPVHVPSHRRRRPQVHARGVHAHRRRPQERLRESPTCGVADGDAGFSITEPPQERSRAR